jgi:hypothetical protein
MKPEKSWDDVIWHFKMIAYGCWITAGIGAIALGWVVVSMWWGR